jgi:TonB family protein
LMGMPVAGRAQADGDNQPPEVLLRYEPVYPRAFLIDGREGSATVVFTVLRNGRTADLRVEKESHPMFGAAAVAALTHWRFAPRIRDGKLVHARARQHFNFRPTADSFFSLEPMDPARRPLPILPLVGPRPDFPTSGEGAARRGYADVQLTVNAAGRVVRAKLLEATEARLEGPAVEAARRWEFNPIDPYKAYQEEHGVRPGAVSPDYAVRQVRLTLLYHPGSSGKPPRDLKHLEAGR